MIDYLKRIIPLGIKRNIFARKIAIKLFKKPIKIWYFRENDFMNFGDELTVDIINKIFNKKTKVVDIDEAELFAVGSIIEVVDRPRYKKAYVWGSGIMAEGEPVKNNNLIFKAVRGYKTRNRIPLNYSKIPVGDPGLLCNLMYNPTVDKLDKIGVIPHYVDETSTVLEAIKNDNRFLIISVKNSPSQVIDNILKCKVVFSSSLHGLIVSDSYNIPNIHMPLSNKLLGAGYKFEDYYSATGRAYSSFNHDDILSEDKVNEVINKYSPVENLEAIQRALISSFPFK